MTRRRNIPKTIEAEQFVLRNQRGTARAVLQMQDGSPAFHLLDRKGLPRIMLLLEQADRLLLRLEETGGASLGISSDEAGKQ